MKKRGNRKVFPCRLSSFSFSLAAIAAILFVAVLFHSKPIDSDSPLFQPGIPSATILTACQNKHEYLLLALSSWVSVSGVDRIIIVDWNSSPRLSDAIPADILNDPKLSLVHVPNGGPYILTWAFNLAFDFAPDSSNVLKVDCDTVVGSDFFSYHHLEGSVYYAGDYLLARNENEKHLSGIFYLNKQLWSAIGGFDERIQGYGWDDSNLYYRLNSSGAAYKSFNMTKLHHLSHPNTDRLFGLKKLSDYVLYEIFVNMIISTRYMSMWGTSFPRCKYDIKKISSGKYIANVKKTVPSQRYIVGNEQLTKTMQTVSGICLSWLSGPVRGCVCDGNKEFICNRDCKIYSLDADYGRMLVDTYFHATQTSSKKILTVHVQHGLGNRLRALGAAMVLAKKSYRWLRVIWTPDMHVNATMDSLFDLPASNLFDVWEDFDSRELEGENVDVYNYMDFKERYRYIDGWSMNHIYVRSAYILNSSIVTEDLINEELRTLVVHPAVRELMSRVEIPANATLVGVHVRSAGPRDEMKGLSDQEYTETEFETMEFYRNHSTARYFVEKMKEAEKAGSGPVAFYVAADNSKEVEYLTRKFPNIITLPNSCSGRTMRCMRTALAELFLLGSCSKIIGSFWSSFTEVAGRLANISVVVGTKVPS